MRRLLVLLLVIIAGCSGLPRNAVAPKVHVAELSLRQFDLFEQHFDVGLKVENPNDFDLTIEALEFDLEVNGQPFAKGASHTAMHIPAAAAARVRIEALTQSQDLVRQLRALPGLLRDGAPYRIRGRVKTDRSSRWLPFEHAGVVGGQKKAPDGRAL